MRFVQKFPSGAPSFKEPRAGGSINIANISSRGDVPQNSCLWLAIRKLYWNFQGLRRSHNSLCSFRDFDRWLCANRLRFNFLRTHLISARCTQVSSSASYLTTKRPKWWVYFPLLQQNVKWCRLYDSRNWKCSVWSRFINFRWTI